jgi:hypothetical protein
MISFFVRFTCCLLYSQISGVSNLDELLAPTKEIAIDLLARA